MPATIPGREPRWRASLMPNLFLLLLFHRLCLCGADSHGWSYKEDLGNGPSNWAKSYPTCGGRFQSPVDLRRARDFGNLTSLVLEGYEKVLKHAVLVNNGHTAQLLASDSRASLSGGCLGTDKYDFVQLHFHWGSNDSVGSEHTVRGRPFPMEGHFVHSNRKYGKVEEALKHPDGIAVLGVFYRSTTIEADFLDALIRAVRAVSREEINEKVKVDPSLTLRKMLPEDLSQFYCYERGSLTTPGCDESVIWTVIEDSVPLSREQVAEFRRLRLDDGTAMVDNFRPVQELNGRTIFFRGTFSSAAAAGHRSDSRNLWVIFFCGCFSAQSLSRRIARAT